jgi:hypothetical protein
MSTALPLSAVQALQLANEVTERTPCVRTIE